MYVNIFRIIMILEQICVYIIYIYKQDVENRALKISANHPTGLPSKGCSISNPINVCSFPGKNTGFSVWAPYAPR